MELRISRVTCMEDRAQVERRGEVELVSGMQQVRVEPFSPVAVDRSLRVELTGAVVVNARIVRTFKPRPPGGVPADASALRQAVHALERELQAREDDTRRLEARLAVARLAREDALRDIAEAAGAGQSAPARWGELLQQAWDEALRVEEALGSARWAVRSVGQRLEEARDALARAERPDEEMTAALELSVEAPSALRAALRISYLVPCAAWRPAYRATLVKEKDSERLTLEADAVVWQRTGEEWPEVALTFSTARPTLGANPPTLQEDRLTLRDKTEAEKRAVEVSFREEEIQTVGGGGTARAGGMPGLDDGGEVRVLSAPHPATVRSDGHPHRLHLFRFDAPARTERICAPELSPLACVLARFNNRGSHLLLAGPVDLIRESGFVGRGQLKVAAVGEEVKLSFGSEDALRVVRAVAEEVEEARLTGRRTTSRTVRLFVSNAGSAPLHVTVEERVPVSELAAVEVRLLADEAKPPFTSVSENGILRYNLALAGHAVQEIRFVYQVSASAKVVGLP